MAVVPRSMCMSLAQVVVSGDMLTGYVHGMIDRDVVQLRHQSTQAGENVDFT